MKLVPLEDRVVLKLMEKEDKTSSGIVLPDTAQEKPQKATVMAVGPGKYDDKGKLVPMPVKVGDIVMFAKYGGTEVKVDGEDYLVLRASDLSAYWREGVVVRARLRMLIIWSNEGDKVHGKTAFVR